MKIGDIVNYYGREATVLDFNETHCLIEFNDSRSKLCTNRLTFSKDK